MTAPAIDPDIFIPLSDHLRVIDVRAPIEYKKGHIPGAINIPLFDDAERAEIGTLYKLKGKEEAVLRGLEIVSPKMADFVRSAKSGSPEKKVLVYCFRGGMRSNSFGWLLRTAGLEAEILKGGYKAYRNYVLRFFQKARPLVLLGGSTGSGKTEILQHLRDLGTATIDLEALAHHKGSAFGAEGQPRQDPQQLFENHLFNAMRHLGERSPLVLEDESMAIGYNKIPYPLWLQMKKAPVLKLDLSFEWRLHRLLREYGNASKETLIASVQKIQQPLGPQHAKQCIAHIAANDLQAAAAIILNYYDRAYAYNYEKREYKNIQVIPSDTDDPSVNAHRIKEVLESPDLSHLFIP